MVELLNDNLLTEEQVRIALLEKLRIYGRGGQVRIARELGVTKGYINQFLTRHRPPSYVILNALGYQKVTLYRKLT